MSALLPNGSVLVAGGNSPPSQYYDSSGEMHDPVAASGSPTASMGLQRAFDTATALQNGAVLVTGPLGSTSCELYE